MVRILSHYRLISQMKWRNSKMVKKSREDIKAWKQQLVDKAEKKIMGLTSSDKFQDYLKTMSKFHKYSARNINLIFSQDSKATMVAGYKQWQRDFNRKVQKGAKSIRIAAPISKELTAEEQAKMETTSKSKIVGYRYLPVFDIRDTKGDSITKASDFINDKLGDHHNAEKVYQAFKGYLNKNTNLQVEERAITEDSARGYFIPDKNEIVIDNQVTDSAMKLKTLYHEYAHSQLHGLNKEFANYPREYQETQAEAVAYVSMQNLGIDTGDYSLGYVATWAKDKDVIHQALSQIHDVSNKTIELSDGLVRDLQRQMSMERLQGEHLTQEVVPKFQEWKPEMGLAASGQIVQQKKDYWKGVFNRSGSQGLEVTDPEGNTRMTLTLSSRKFSDRVEQSMGESIVQTPTVLEKIKPSQAPFVKEITFKAEFSHSYDYDEVEREYSAYSTKEGVFPFYECNADDSVEQSTLKDGLAHALNANEITVEDVVGPNLAIKLSDKTQKFVNEHLTNDGLKAQVNGLNRLKSTVSHGQLEKVNNSLKLANNEVGRRGLDLSQNMSMQALNRQTIQR